MNSTFKFLYLSVLSAFFLPLVSHAALSQTLNLISYVGQGIEMLLVIAASLALLYFFWGLAKFILNSASDEGREEGKQVMKWGIVALFVMVSVWGIVLFIRQELGITYEGDSRVPGFDQNAF